MSFYNQKGKVIEHSNCDPPHAIIATRKMQEMIEKKTSDSKLGGPSWTQGRLKSKKVGLGSKRLRRPNVARGGCSFNWNRETPDQNWDLLWPKMMYIWKFP